MSGIFINSDTWNFWFNDANMNADGVRRDVDFYTKQGGVEAVFYNMNFQRAFFPSKVWTPIWKDCEVDADGNLLLRGKKTDNSFKPLVVNCKKLWDSCPDFMKIRYDRCHENGSEMWHSMRMDDTHNSVIGREHLPQHSDLWQERKDLLRAWYRHFWRQDWHDNAFDYGKKEVFDYHLALVREYLMEYESDGIELDWHRSMPIFKPGYDEVNTPVFTQFMRDVRAIADEAAKKWGHRIRVAALVPYRVVDAIGMGIDAKTWCREKLVDILIPSEHHHSTNAEYQLRIWRLIVPKDVILAPCIDCSVTCNCGTHMTLGTDCGFASSFYEMGADSLYFYNHFPTTLSYMPEMREFFSFAADRRAVSARPRRHCVTKYDPLGEGKFRLDCFPPEIWAGCCDGSVRINCGEGNDGRRARIIIGSTKKLNVDVLLNTVKCELMPDDEPVPVPLPKKEAFWLQARIPDGMLHDGWNAVELFNKADTSIFSHELLWMEVYVEDAEARA